MELEPTKKNDKSRVVMSCMQVAQDGQRYRLNKGSADKVRQHVVEYYMTRHPHDCPVCDEAGHCHLQDMTILSRQTYRRYDGKKQTFPDQEMGPLIWNTANRCITCYRCARFYQNYALGDDFGVYCSGQKTTFRRSEPGAFDSPFSGNIIDVCPTGTFTDKVFRRKYSRTWQLEKATSVCNHCSTGCNTEPGGREGTLRRIHPMTNPHINPHFICDRGRYGEHYSEASDRPLKCIIRKGAKNPYDNIYTHLTRCLKKASGRIGILSSEHEDLQTHYMLKQLAVHYKGTFSPFILPDTETRTRSAIQATQLPPSLPDIETADAAIIVGSLTEAAPMMDLAVRQLIAKQKPIIMVHAVPSLLADLIQHRNAGEVISATPKNWHQVIDHLDTSRLSDEKVKKIVLLGVAGEMDVPAINAFSRLKEKLSQETVTVQSGFALEGANAMGAAVISNENSAHELLEAIQKLYVDTLIVCGADPFGEGAAEWEPLRNKIRQLIVLDNINTETVKQADIVLPLATWSERCGYSVNYEGRVQPFEQAYQRSSVISPTEFVAHLTPHSVEALYRQRDVWLTQLSAQLVISDQMGIQLNLQQLSDIKNTYSSHVETEGLQLVKLPWHGGGVRADFAKELASCNPWKDHYVYLHTDTAKQLNVTTGKQLHFKSGASLEVLCDNRITKDCLAVTPLTLGRIKCKANIVLPLHQIHTGETDQ